MNRSIPPGRTFTLLKRHILAFLAGLFLFITPWNTFSQDKGKLVTGIITDETGASLPGVNVMVKGTSLGATSDGDGKYALQVQDGTATLVFSFIGYATREEALNNRTSLDISLEPDIMALQEVVIIGYGQSTKGDLTGAVSQVKMADVAKAPVPTFDQALAGRVAGVQVVSNDGQPGSVGEIIIRGVGSMSNSTAPLYVVDGFPQEASTANTINPADIESIDVLKDASATAIYGARGANGVVIITTKRGKEGTPKLTYNVFYGAQEMLKKMELMNAYEFVKLQTEINSTYAAQLYFTDGKDLESYRNVKGIDWQDQVFRTAMFANHSLSISGRSGKTGYYLSGNYVDQEGLVINSAFRRYQGRLNLDQELSDKAKVGITLNYGTAKSTGAAVANQTAVVGVDGATPNNGQFNLLYNVWTYRPVGGATSEDDLLNNLYDDDAANAGEELRTNPVLAAENEYDMRRDNNLSTNAFLEYKLMKNLVLRVSGGVNLFDSEREVFRNSQTRGGSPFYTQGRANGPNGGTTWGRNVSYLNENTLTYNTKINNDHSIQAVIGATSQKNTSQLKGFNSIQVLNESLGISGLDEGIPLNTISTSSNSTLASFLGRVNYNYKSRYMLTASFRADGSSKFPSASRWGYFPSGAIAWRIGNENFMSAVESVVSDAKFRVSYGVTGNNRVNDFAYKSLFQSPVGYRSSFNNRIQFGNGPAQIENNALTWETTAMLDIGLELSFLDNKVNLEVDYYQKKTSDLLLNTNITYITGFGNAQQNIGDIRNDGLEITVNTNLVTVKDFTWSANVNISFNRNRLLKLASGEESRLNSTAFDQSFATQLYLSKLGHPVGMFYGYVSDGLYQVSDFEKLPNGVDANGNVAYQYVMKDAVPNYVGASKTAIQPGDVKQKDLNGDGTINNEDLTVIGNPWPVHIGGFTNNFAYKGFDLNIFFQWSYGNDVFNANRIMMEGQQTPADDRALGRNQFATYADRWSFDNQDGQYPKARAIATGVRAYATRLVEDASFLRLKTVQLGYTIPTEWTSRLRIQSLKIFASAQNLKTWTNYSGPDPEVATRFTALTPGFDYSPYPRTRVLTVGANVTF